eukprot:g1738.t1
MIRPGDNLFGISNYYYLMDDWMAKKVLMFNQECHRELSAPGVLAGKHEPAHGDGSMIQVGRILAIPMPVRACDPGWQLLPAAPNRGHHPKMSSGCKKMVVASDPLVHTHCSFPTLPAPAPGSAGAGNMVEVSVC